MASTLALLGIGIGCDSSEDDVPVGTTTTYYGTYVDPVYSGVMELTGTSIPTGATMGGVQAEQIPVNGELRLPGLTITLVGSFDTDTGYMVFASDDESYQFFGNVVAGQCLGSSTGPNGDGTFALFVNGSASNVTTYCGTAVCDTPVDCQAYGSFNLSVSGTVALLTVNYNGASGLAVGTATASAVDFSITQGGQDITVHGDINGSTLSGTWSDNNNGYGGTWSGSTAQCSSVAMRR
jgi:hypothetical protein